MLLDRVFAPVGQIPNSPAFVYAGTPISYQQFRALTARTIAHLRQQGIKGGDVVALAMPQSPLYLIAFLALGWIGALAVPIAPTLRPVERDELMRKYKVSALLTPRLEVVPRGIRLVQLEGVGATGDETLEEAGRPSFGEIPLRIAVTSGTTGRPRGVLHSHASFEQRLDRMHFGPVDRPVVIPPALHITLATFLSIHALCRGGTVVFPRTYGNEHFFEAIRDHGVTHVALPPANLGLMLRSLPPEGPAFPGVRHLRLLATLTPAVLKSAQAQFSPHVHVPYGITEVGVVSMATPEMLRDDPTTVGPLEPGVTVQFGTNGEIGVKVPGMPKDYHGPDAGQGTRFRDGHFWPGDRARLENGWLYIEGRTDHIINTGGRKVAPEVVEAVLMEFPGVRDAAAFGTDDGAGGIIVAAKIVAEPGLDVEALRAFADQRLQLTAPKKYTEVASLPRNTMGKLQRDRLAV
jgi:acyl-coenzyme A synthetase/AMP-(fatty) acid ligase